MLQQRFANGFQLLNSGETTSTPSASSALNAIFPWITQSTQNTDVNSNEGEAMKDCDVVHDLSQHNTDNDDTTIQVEIFSYLFSISNIKFTVLSLNFTVKFSFFKFNKFINSITILSIYIY